MDNNMSFNDLFELKRVNLCAANTMFLDRVKELKEKGKFLPEIARMCAVRNSNFALLTWMYKNGDLDHNIYKDAIIEENLLVLEWLINIGFPKHTDAIEIALLTEKYLLADWLDENGFPIDRHIKTKFIRPVKKNGEVLGNARGALQWLCCKGYL